MDTKHTSFKSTPSCSCGCLSFIFIILYICFFISFFKNCTGRTIEESIVQTAKDYYQMADSIWNE